VRVVVNRARYREILSFLLGFALATLAAAVVVLS